MKYISGDPKKDFFDQNPELKFKKEFAKLLKPHRRQKGSKIMWAIYMMEDPSSHFFRIPYATRLEEIQAVYFPEFDPEKYQDIIDAYKKLILDKEVLLYSIHIRKMEQLTSVLEDLDLEEKASFDKYIKIVEKLPRAWEALKKVKVDMFDAMDKSNVHGDRALSSREKRARS